MAKTVVIDFTDMKEPSNINPKQVEPGEYLATIVGVEDKKSQKDQADMWLVIFKVDGEPSARYPYYVKHSDKASAWKAFNLFHCAGFNAKRGKMKLDPDKLVNRTVGVTMEDDEYEGRMKSVVTRVFSPSELSDNGITPAPASEEEEDDDEMEIDEL
jgi:hypothetical protein